MKIDFLQIATKGKNNSWMYILTLILIFIGIQLASIPLMVAAFFTVDGDMQAFQKGAADSFMSIGMNANLFLFLMIVTFMAAILVLYLCVRFLHQRPFQTVVTARARVDWKRIGFAFLIWAGISIAIVLLGILLEPEQYTWNFKPVPFAILVLISFVFLPFQTSAEELVFRGYLMQWIGMLAKNRWAPLFFTSVIFGLMHWMNPEVAELGPITMVFYIGTGFLFGITTLMDEGTELALGMHAANNIVAAFLVTTDWMVFRTDALFVDHSTPEIGADIFISVIVLYPLVLWVFAKKYQWSDWKEKLTGKFKLPESNHE